jgi:hypothetical protein
MLSVLSASVKKTVKKGTDLFYKRNKSVPLFAFRYYVGPAPRSGRYEMDVDGPFGERALLLFTVIETLECHGISETGH